MVLNRCEICNSCLSLQLTAFKNIFQVAGNAGRIPLKEFSHLVQTQPHAFIVQTYFKARAIAFNLVEKKFAPVFFG